VEEENEDDWAVGDLEAENIIVSEEDIEKYSGSDAEDFYLF